MANKHLTFQFTFNIKTNGQTLNLFECVAAQSFLQLLWSIELGQNYNVFTNLLYFDCFSAYLGSTVHIQSEKQPGILYMAK